MAKAGRKKGSKNILNKEVAKDFSEFFKKEFKGEIKNFPIYPPETKVNILLKVLPYVLPKRNITSEESEIQKIVYEALLPHFKKLGFYLSHIPTEKKSHYLLRLLKQMHPIPYQQNEISEIVKDLNKGREKLK